MAKIKIKQKYLLYGGFAVIGIALIAKILRKPTAIELSTAPINNIKPVYPLQLGSNGSEVLKLQKFINSKLKYVGISPLLVEDGIWGPKTDAAVKKVFGGITSINEKVYTDNVLNPTNNKA